MICRWLLFLFIITNALCQSDLNQHVRKLTSQLKSPDQAAKIAALDSLGELGQHAAPAIPMMIHSLKENPPVVYKTLEAFAKLGPIAQSASYELIKLLSKPDKKTIVLTRKAFIAMKQKALPELLKNVNHESFIVRSHILYILGEIKSSDAVSFIIPKLNDDKWQVRYAGLEALSKIAPQQIASQIIDKLVDKNLSVQILAIKICGNSKPANRQFLKPLAKIFHQQTHFGIRKNILQALAKIKITSVETQQVLTKSLKISSLRLFAIQAISKTANYSLVEEVLPFADHENHHIRIAVMDSIGNLKNQGVSLVDHLIVAATDGNKNVRMHAANAMGKLGPSVATATMPSLLSLLEDSENEVQTYAAIALGKMGKETVAILGDLIVRNPRLRSHAAYALAQIGQDSVPTLIRLLKKPDRAAKFYAAEALGRIQHNDVQKAVPALIQVLKETKNKQHFIEVLGKIGGNAANELIPLLADKHWQVRKAAADALVIIGPAIIPLISQTLKHDNKHVVLYSISIVGRLREDGKTLSANLEEIYI